MRICLFLLSFLFSDNCPAQLSADSIGRYLSGRWQLCGVGQQSYFFDSDAATDVIMEEHDAIRPDVDFITFFGDGTYTFNDDAAHKPFRISRLLEAYLAPFKIALDKTEYIFEIRDPGFMLKRPILGTFDENEIYVFSFERPGACKDP